MMFAGHEIGDPIHRGRQTTIHRGKRTSDGQPVVVKLLDSDFPDIEEIERIRREHRLLSLVDSPHVVSPLGLEEHGRGLALVLEDVGGEALGLLGVAGNLDLRSFLGLGIQAARGLAAIHRAGVIHKDLSPGNIVWNRQSDRVQVIDLNIAQRLSARSGGGSGPGVLEGTMAYVSPEQTGRMNRSVDTRSDLYSLGATLYEVLAGQPPFTHEEPLELVHAHIARPPRPPHHLDDSIPVAVSDILLRLLAKRAEDRYQTARGLEADLAICVAQLDETGAVARFELGQSDLSDRFGLSQSLYGRDAELAELRAAFDEVHGAQVVGAVFIEGEPGAGKTTLVQELYRPVVDAGGWLVSGHAAEGDSSVPYAAIAGALEELANQLLASTDEALAAWKARVLPALEPNAGIVTALVPSLALVLGDQLAPPELTAAHDQARFRITLGRFLRALATPDSPVVFFLDDLQWADRGTLDLVELAVTDPLGGHLLLVGAYRPLPKGSSHPLVELPGRLRDQGLHARELRLAGLDGDHVARLLADSLHREPEQARDLAEVCLRKTEGNPFFLVQFLCSLHEDGALRFEPEAGWGWDLDRIDQLDVTDNVVELMSARMGRLSPEARDALRLASCAGRTFDAQVVSQLGGVDPLACLGAIQEAVAEGLVSAAGGAFRFTRKTAGGASRHLPSRYRFVHDRIRQAAWSLSSDEQRRTLHLALARRRREELPAQPSAEELFDVVSHFAQAGPLLQDEDERVAVAALYLDAGKRAKRALAVDAALEHLERGVALLPPEPWADQYDLCRGLHLEATFCAQLSGDDAGMERWGQAVLENSRSAMDSIPVYVARVSFFHTARQQTKSLEWFVRGTRLLKARFPLRPGIHDILGSFLALQVTLARGRKLDDEGMQPMTDPRALALLQLIRSAGAAAYSASPNLIPMMAFAVTGLTARLGGSRDSAWGVGGYAMVLLAAFGRVDAGLRVADAALSLQRRFGEEADRASAEFIYYAMIHHWRAPVLDALPPLEEASRVGLDHGELDGAVLCRQIIGLVACLGGLPLPEASRALDESERLMGRFNQGWYFECNAMRKHSLRDLDGGDEVTLTYSGEPFDPEVFLDETGREGDVTSAAMCHLHRAFVLFLLGDREQALVHSRAVDPHMEAVLATFYEPVHALVFALCLLDEARREPARASGLIRKARRKARSLRSAADRAPGNYLPMWRLVQAEVLRTRGQGYEAIPTYEDARRLGRENGLDWLAPLASELLAEVLREGGSEELADVALRDAWHAWRRWGALAKVARLEREHPELLERTASTRRPPGTRTTVRTTTGSQASDRLDLETILKTSQTLSEELVLSELLDRMIAAVLENAAAQRGLLLSRRGSDWHIDAEQDLGAGDPAGSGVGSFAREVVQYVARTGRVVVLGDAAVSTDFGSDPYVRRRRPRSLLCIALEHRGEQTGILYLENNDTTDVFTEDRVEVLRMLCGQIAISIENARLFAEQEQLNRAYERFVPREFLGLLGKASIVDVELGDQVEREMTVLFSDVQGFTALSEAMGPAENFAFINEFLSMMEPVFSRFSGFVDKYIGDAIMALFPTGADDALAAAVGMVRELAVLNERRAAHDLPPVRIGIGLNSGLLMLGTVGGPKRMDGTVISDAVNLASRMEGLTRVYGATILISGRTYGYLRDPEAFEIRAIGKVRVKGKSTPVSVMEVLDGEPEAARELKRQTLPDFNDALVAYVGRDFERAAALLGSVLKRNPADAAAARYLVRCQRLAEQGVPDDWDGVEQMDSK